MARERTPYLWMSWRSAPLQQGGSWSQHQQAEWLGWTGGAGWLSRHLWDAWLVTRDEALLREYVLPVIEEVITFYDDFLVLGSDNIRHAIPSVSVENKPSGWSSRWTIDATMEIAICREMLRHGCAAYSHLNKTIPYNWLALQQQLPAYRINQQGELAEWIHPDHGDHHHHRHLSHLYPLFPGDEFMSQPSMRDAAKQAVDARLTTGQRSQTGWSLVHLAHLHARLGNGSSAMHCLERLMRSCVQKNLLTVHDDWRGQGITLGHGERERGTLQLDAIYGFSSAIQECLIQSGADYLTLLPALSLKHWPTGAAHGLSSRCGVEVN